MPALPGTKRTIPAFSARLSSYRFSEQAAGLIEAVLAFFVLPFSVISAIIWSRAC